MLLAVDVGNTETVLGVFDGDRLVHNWRLETSDRRTADEYAAVLHSLFSIAKLDPSKLNAGIVCCVVPAALEPLEQTMQGSLGWKPLVVAPGMKSGMPVSTDNPREVGADRIVNAVAAYERFGGPVIVVDFGTATTVDCVSAKGEYLGGAIAPGLGISADALYHHAAKLPRVEVKKPSSVVGKNTVASIQAGLYFGYAALVDGLVRRMKDELGGDVRVIATGGMARVFSQEAETIEEADPLLTLRGLKILFDRASG